MKYKKVIALESDFILNQLSGAPRHKPGSDKIKNAKVLMRGIINNNL